VNQCTALAHLSKSSHWPEKAFPDVGSPASLIVERDDGMFQIGWHEYAAGPFQTRDFAQAVAIGEGQHALAT
jgi:hypothetical protein